MDKYDKIAKRIVGFCRFCDDERTCSDDMAWTRSLVSGYLRVYASRVERLQKQLAKEKQRKANG